MTRTSAVNVPFLKWVPC